MVGALGGQPGRRVIVLTGGGRECKASRIFVNPQAHDSGFLRGNRNALFSNNVDHQCRVRADFTDDFQLAVYVVRGSGVMVVYVDFHIFAIRQPGKVSDTALLPGVHQNQPFDGIDIDFFDFGDIQEVKSGIQEKISEIFLLRAGKNQGCFRIEFAGSQHGGEGVKIGVDMGRNNLCMNFLKLFLSLLSRSRGLRHGAFPMTRGKYSFQSSLSPPKWRSCISRPVPANLFAAAFNLKEPPGLPHACYF